MSTTFESSQARPTATGPALHVVEAGDPDGDVYVLLHGWPESWSSWRPMMEVAAPEARVLAVDLPGIGGSDPVPDGGRKQVIADVVHELVDDLGLRDVTLVGHDAGGMAAYAALRLHPDLRRVVIVNTVIPGVDPWDQVLANPYIWHFAFHSLPDLPELLVQGHQRAYFDFFTEQLSVDPTRIGTDVRDEHAAAYASDASLHAGFELYRSLMADAADNRRLAEGPPTSTPLLYIRGDGSPGAIDTYAAGFRAAGVTDLQVATVADAGHFTQEEAPVALWDLIRDA